MDDNDTKNNSKEQIVLHCKLYKTSQKINIRINSNKKVSVFLNKEKKRKERKKERKKKTNKQTSKQTTNKPICESRRKRWKGRH